MALCFGQPFHLAEDGGGALRLVNGLVCGDVSGNETLSEDFVDLLGMNAPLSIDGEIPGYTYQPNAGVAHLLQRTAMLQYADEDVLNDVLGFGAASQDGVSYAEQECRVCLNERREICRVDLRPVPFHGEWSQTASFDRRHRFFLTRQTADAGNSSTLVSSDAGACSGGLPSVWCVV